MCSMARRERAEKRVCVGIRRERGWSFLWPRAESGEDIRRGPEEGEDVSYG